MKNLERVLRNGYIKEDELLDISKKNKDYIVKNWEYIINRNSGKGYYVINNSNITKCDYQNTKLYCQLNG